MYLQLDMIEFEWNLRKSRENANKHGVTFEEAQSVFYDDNAIQFYDADHSDEEDRFILLGLSIELNLLVVCHCERENGEVIRIISARKATRKESRHYRGGGK